MIYTDKTKTAMRIAYDAHCGQFDIGHTPYIFHPFHVAEQMTTETETVVALLHDVFEDCTEYRIESMRAHLGDEIVDAIDAITKRPGEDYGEYIKRVKANAIATAVKVADLAHNMDATRLDFVTQEDLKRIAKYKDAYNFLRGWRAL